MKKIVVSLLFICACVFVQGQPPRQQRSPHREERREQMEAQKVAFLTIKMELTTETSQKFWPIYNSYRNELDQARRIQLKQIKRIERASMNTDRTIKVPVRESEMTDAEWKELIESRFRADEEKLRIEKKYYLEFQKVLTLKQLAKFYKAEEEFKREILKELRRR